MPLINPTILPANRGLAPTAIDLFCGVGGLTVGLKAAGFDVIAGVEIDGLAVEGYVKNHPDVWVWHEDISHVEPNEILDKIGLKVGEVGLLAGCPPCEGFSRIRSRNGKRKIEDDRNNLIFEFQRFVDDLRPRTVMLENVPGLAVDHRFKEFCEHLTSLGYHLVYGIKNAADYGVPQRRKRLILLGSLFERPEFPPPDHKRTTVYDAIGDLPKAGTSGDPLHDIMMRNSARIMKLIQMIPPDGGSRRDLPEELQLECHRRIDGFKDVYGRMKWRDVAPTITGGCANPSKGRFLHPVEHRVISLREAALLQTFPPDYYIPLRRGRYAAAELIGNALPPVMISRFAEVAYKHVVAC